MPKTILFLGNSGSNSHQAALKIKKDSDKLAGANSFEEIFNTVEKNKNRIGVIPLENTLTGSINPVFDLFKEKKVYIILELILKINHCLIAKTKRKISSFRYCLSHQEVFKQCSRFMAKNRNLTPMLESDTSSACQKLLKLNNQYSSLGSKNAASLFGLTVLYEHLEDFPLNFTRFVAISNQQLKTGNKISLLFSLKHRPGTLVKALRPIAENNFNLTKIESRPIVGKPWEYLFFVDLETDNGFEKFKSCLSQIKKQTVYLKVLGQYKKGEITDA